MTRRPRRRRRRAGELTRHDRRRLARALAPLLTQTLGITERRADEVAPIIADQLGTGWLKQHDTEVLAHLAPDR